MAIGGKEVVRSLHAAVLEFDKYFSNKDYSIQDMEKALDRIKVGLSVKSFYESFSISAFFSKHKKWILSGTGVLGLLLAIYYLAFRKGPVKRLNSDVEDSDEEDEDQDHAH